MTQKMNRREFVATTTTAGLATVLPNVSVSRAPVIRTQNAVRPRHLVGQRPRLPERRNADLRGDGVRDDDVRHRRSRRTDRRCEYR